MKIFIIGYRCTGKTTVGKMLADRLHYDFLDMDQIIEQQSESTISNLIDHYGWENFRRLEKKVLYKTVGINNTIVSTGGGIVIDSENINFIKKNGYAIWLDADIKTILSRLELDPSTPFSRPSLTRNNLDEETKELLETRRPLYEKTAQFKIETDSYSPQEIVTLIERKLF